ncbi:PWWP domain-containing DNA repair factor 3A isoform X2 [Centropristis striata]|uniref:PWWP domain-containing DNA repair factor 3A isoform X2 n=1 Tax=Centropristis striata TaxID=184440 RepID=UPI0027E1EA25|nr:PWWP domain-containing DNA repair factor 3A isoform X2 [Centropristis striata]
MKGGSQKTRKRDPKKTPKKRVTSDTVSPEVNGESNAVPSSDVGIFSQSPAIPLPSTPKRARGRMRQTRKTCLTSTPVRSSSTDIQPNIADSPPRAKQMELEYTEVITQLKTSELDSPCFKTKSRSTRRKANVYQSRQVRKRVTKEETETGSKINSPPAKRRRARTRKVENGDSQRDTTAKSSERPRPRFELEKPDVAEQDLSIELSDHEEQLPSLFPDEDEGSGGSHDDDEEEDLPSFLMQVNKKPPSITKGAFVWSKYRNYPFWPALVKSVNCKQKKASIVFIDEPMIHKKGFTVALRSLKPFECADMSELVCKAKESYDAAITWSLELISDYTIRKASFSGSFIEYFDHDMSYPVRRKYPQAASERLTIVSDSMLESPCADEKEDSFSKQHEEVSRKSKRLLPDRSHAAHNRANEKLVHFIVKQRMVEEHLLAVMRGQQQSRWLRSFLSASRRRVVNIYLEDDQQLDQVYLYLNGLYTTAMATIPYLAEMNSMQRVPFVLDVLLPEAIIYAIAGVDNVPVKKAEEKYLKGRCISNRERQHFDLMIDRQMKRKSQRQLALFSDPVS